MVHAESLATLAKAIRDCRQCDQAGISVIHPDRMRRGNGRLVMAIGEQPGRTELEKGVAFSGQGGKRLLGWLSEAGLGEEREEIEQLVYFTSLAKCLVRHGYEYPLAVKNCGPFLNKQIDLIRPKILVTLGRRPVKMIFGTDRELDQLVGEIFYESEIGGSLFPVLPKQALIVPFPHPSPISRWLNDASNQGRLKLAITKLRIAAEAYQ